MKRGTFQRRRVLLFALLCNDWDFANDQKDYTICFEEKIKPQVTEILTQYGDLWLIGFDTPHTISPEQSREMADLVHHYQPTCLVNSRIGNGMGDNEIMEDFFVNELVECPATLNDIWGYKSFDNHWKDADRVLELKEHLNGRGVNDLLNVGPDYLSRIPGPSVDILREAGKRV